MAPAKKKDTGLSLASGGIAGAIEACCTWPMEYIKTQLQLMSNVKGGKPPPYNGILSGISYTVRTTGFLSLYRGARGPSFGCARGGAPPVRLPRPLLSFFSTVDRARVVSLARAGRRDTPPSRLRDGGHMTSLTVLRLNGRTRGHTDLLDAQGGHSVRR